MNNFIVLKRLLAWTFERRNAAGQKTEHCARIDRRRVEGVLSLFLKSALDYWLSALVYIDTHEIFSGFQWS
jgi:hypothetical protein